MKEYMEYLQARLAQHSPDLGDCESVLGLLYEAFSDVNPMPDPPEIKADFRLLYEKMNGMSMREMDQVLDPVCSLCRHHERSGFMHGVQIGVALATELKDPTPQSEN